MCSTSSHNVSTCPYYLFYVHSDLPLALPLAQSFGYAANLGMDSALCGLEETHEWKYNLVYTPLEGCQDLFVHEGSSSLIYENVIPNSHEPYHVSTMCSLPSSPSPKLAFDVPIDNSEICEPNVKMGHEDNMINLLGGIMKLLSP